MLAFVPGAGWISNLVTTGPGKTDSTVASIPNSSNLVSNKAAIWLSSSSVRDEPSSKALSNRAVLGITAFSFWSSWIGSFDSTSLITGSEVFGKSGCWGIVEVLLDSSLIVDFLSFETIFDFSILVSSFSAFFTSLISLYLL